MRLEIVCWLMLSVLLLTNVIGCGVREHKIGGQKDRQGCNTSAGYTWSALIADCIRTFELPVQMTDLQTSTAQTTYGSSAHFSEDQKMAEVFHLNLAGGSMILERGPTGIYHSEDGKYLLLQDPDRRWLFKLIEQEGSIILASQ